MSSKFKSIRYRLEIYEPGSSRDILKHFESTGPFQAITVGDLIGSQIWDDATTQGNILEVTRVQHLVWEDDNSCSHQLMVFTKEVPDDPSQCRNGAV